MQCRAAGEVTGASTGGGHGYNVLNGKSVAAKKKAMADASDASMDAMNRFHPQAGSSPTKGRAAAAAESVSYDERIMSGGVNQYKNAAEALKPIGNYPATSLISGPPSSGDMSYSKEFSSHRLYKQEMRKHTRPVLGPKDKTMKPVTSSQVYGWFPDGSQSVGYEKTSDHHYERRFCPETRFAVSLSLGPRHKNGYGGQGTL